MEELRFELRWPDARVGALDYDTMTFHKGAYFHMLITVVQDKVQENWRTKSQTTISYLKELKLKVCLNVSRVFPLWR